MSWIATLIDGPLEGQRITVMVDHDEPPPTIDVDGERYMYCGFSENTPRYRHDRASEIA